VVCWELNRCRYKSSRVSKGEGSKLYQNCRALSRNKLLLSRAQEINLYYQSVSLTSFIRSKSEFLRKFNQVTSEVASTYVVVVVVVVQHGTN
jgi:hypothetical protein